VLRHIAMVVCAAALGAWLGSATRAQHAMASTGAATLDDLPVVEHLVRSDSAAAAKVLVLLFSGDGGWSTLTRELTATLNAAGCSVIGWNTLRYFWRAKTPLQAAADLDRVIRFYTDRLDTDRVILAGYSMGADVLPALTNRLSDGARHTVQSVVLLAPGRATAFEFHVTGWLNRIPTDAVPIKPEVVRLLQHTSVVCVYGADEARTSLCTELGDTAATRIELPGAHHFDGNYAELAELVLHGKVVS
jgi:type IV secretory pathway VirJ component